MMSEADMKRAIKLLKRPPQTLSNSELTFVMEAMFEADPIGFQINLETVAENLGYRNLREMRDAFERKVNQINKIN